MKVLFIYSFFKTKQNQTKICTVCNVCLRLSLKVHTHHHNSSWAWLSEKLCHAHCAPPPKNYFAFVNLCHRCPHQKIIISSLKYPPAISILCNLYQIHQMVSRIFCNYESTKLSRN